MKSTKNYLPLSLMASGLLLLLALQVLWLKNAYREAYDNFNNETNILFHTTVLSLQDSMIRKSIKPYDPDSIPGRKIRLVHDSVKILSRAEYFSDSLPAPEKDMHVQVFFMNGNPDSMEHIMNPLISTLNINHSSKNFWIRLGNDSLNIDSLKKNFRNNLQKNGIRVPFTIIMKKSGKLPDEIGNKTSVTEFTPTGPSWQYAANFDSAWKYILKSILPEILFSFVVTALIILSFYLMVANLRSGQRIMELKNDFISNITHELKSPVAAVSVAIEALRNFNVMDNRQKADQYLEIAQNELSRLNLMADKILQALVLEQKSVEFEPGSVNLDSLVQQVLDSMQLIFEKLKATVEFFKEGNDFMLEGSSVHLSNVLYNLLDNALKYGGERVKISINLKADDDMIWLSVSDNGPGIATEYQQKIFEKFNRIPSGDIHNSKGYGLGLYYVDEVVSSHQGNISVISKPGEGSTFRIKLPRRHA